MEENKELEKRLYQQAREKLIVALDVSTLEEAEEIIKQLAPLVCYFKFGSELLSAVGVPAALELARKYEVKAFIDLAFNNIPTTVGKAVAAIAKQQVAITNVQASAGIDAMMEAVKNRDHTLIFAVTAPVSFDCEEAYLAFGMPPSAKVLQYARDAALANMDGIICPAKELEMLAKHKELEGLLRIVTGIRPDWTPPNDQNRFMTPYEAIMRGAYKIVIDQPITNPPKGCGRPDGAALSIIGEIVRAIKDIEKKKAKA